MDYWRNNTIWFDQIPNNLFSHLNLKEDKLKEMTLQEIEYLILWHYKNKLGNFIDMPIPEGLLYLELNWSNIQNFIGIEKLVKLKRLELHDCTKLKSDCGLSKIANTLEHLHINQSKKFVPTEELFSLKNIRVLCLNSCGNLENLSFLNQFPNLIDFRFVDTNVLDGNLSPILEHPTIRNVGFLNKRHYNISSERMEALLTEKNNDKEYKSIVEKGEFQTFRYNY
ncbi:hypothetical protein [Bacillus sp. UNC322MFChir4.1]|uniref:hypothetical protein n=1 Tax=Bacillus sp. UNC322MFChir4.1 TaxID=1449045 RepID=UPI000559612C|nr:hypothetical protein [Bacillus sp. UNC322MFChir4.1]